MKKTSVAGMLPLEAEDAARILAGKIRTARIARSWTQEELAQRCDMSARTVGIETGAVTVQYGFVLRVLWALDLIEDFIRLIRGCGLNEREFALMEAAQPRRVRERRKK